MAGRSISTVCYRSTRLEDLRASLKAEEPLDIKVHIVQGVTGIYKCTKCGHQNELKPGEYTPSKQPTRKRTATFREWFQSTIRVPFAVEFMSRA